MVLGRRSVIAASFILIVAGLATSWFAYAPRSYVTGIGERRIVVLSDGSRLSLDAATEVDVRFHDSSRQLWLKRGRANFNVAKDALRPFSVAVGRTVVVATGTEFSVEVVGGQVHVVLVEGRVAILKDQGAATGRTHVDLTPISGSGGGQGVQADHYLTPGRELIMSAKAGDAHILPVDPQRSLSWESGQLIFSDEPLQTAVDRVNRYTKSPIMVGDGRAAAIPISGVFAAGDTQAFINGVTAVFPVHLAVTDHRRMLVSGGAPNG
jgi:transmembrane sensor